MRLTSFSVFTLTSLLAFSTTAASVTVRWWGMVPSLDCASRAISNQSKSAKQPQTMVRFDI